MFTAIQKKALWILNLVLEIMLGALVLDVLLGVFSRYIFGSQVAWTEELSVVLLIWVSFLGIASAFAEKAHLGLDIITMNMEPKSRRFVQCFTHLVTIVFVAIVFVSGGIHEVANSITYLNILPALQVPDVIRVIPLPVSGIFILLFELYHLKNAFCGKEAAK